MPKRRLNERARGKHIGHACEGHLRGLISHLDGVCRAQVSRQLPFDTPVDPDAVLLSTGGRIRTVFVVAYWEEAGSSHKKMHRTRTEYREIHRVRQAQPVHFDPSFRIVTVIYGTDTGWKEQILVDLANQCGPLVFVPRVTGCDWTSIVGSAYRTYVARWEAGFADAREHVEQQTAGSALNADDYALLEAIQTVLGARVRRGRPVDERIVATRFPDAPVSTRYRQALGLLSLYRDTEIRARLARRPVGQDEEARRFALRSVFLDMGRFQEKKSILGGNEVSFVPRVAVEDDGRYAPHRPDFVRWEAMDQDALCGLLGEHRGRTQNPTRVFMGGAFDQCAGNLEAICAELRRSLPGLVQAARRGQWNKVKAALSSARLTGPEPWHPAAGFAMMCPLWAFTVGATAIARNERGLRSRHDARRQNRPSAQECSALLHDLRGVATGVADILAEALPFLEALQDGDLATLARLARPRLLALDEPCSWLADVYNTLTTNSSHNPLNGLLGRYLRLRFPDTEWHGWPSRRTVAASAVIEGADGRRQWGFVGIDGEIVVCAEVKSVTANNWGNKSKELYDRVGELQRVSSVTGRPVRSILMFDGDLSRDALAELGSGIAHDEIWTVDDILAECGAMSGTGVVR
ncbi:MAG: hypothetical protein JW751_00010 [Polyangiaceae bacterium]|nr:hypothetical protein [Polyangiaceae bacterium]